MKFILFHGAFGSPENNWFPKLKENLVSYGQTVVAPQFPVDKWDIVTKKGPKVPLKNQSLDNWLKTSKTIVSDFKRGEGLCFIGHSLGCVFILHLVEKYNIELDSAIFVSPFLDQLHSNWQLDHANQSFYKTDFDFDKLKKLIPISYVLYSDSDPYVSKSHSTLFAKALDSSFIFIKKAGHLNSEVNLNEFPLVLELCKTRIELPAYQQFIAHRSNLFAVDYVGDKTEEVIHLNPKDVFGYGLFQFRNLRKSGFCTFLTSNSDFDPQSIYMCEARKAAQRTKDVTRVFVISNPRDLKKKPLIKQIELDLQANIKIGFCLLEDIVKEVHVPDFGIWDDDYVCYVSFNKKNVPIEVMLSSRKADLKKACVWKEILLQKTTRIRNMKDIQDFFK